MRAAFVAPSVSHAVFTVASAAVSAAFKGSLRARHAAFCDSHTGSGMLVQQLPITGR